MGSVIERRRFLRHGGAALSAFATARGVAASQSSRAEEIEIQVISRQPQCYLGWPTVARTKGGTLFLAYSGGREAHVCPFGRVELMTSSDDGRSWSEPRILLDSPLDDRDAGVVETALGAILITTFTSLAYEPILEKAEQKKPGEPDSWGAERLARWRAARDRLTAEERRAQLGQFMFRSTDGGRNWSDKYPVPVNSPHGPVLMSDGRLLYAGRELWTGEGRVGVCESRDDGLTWNWLATIAPRPGDRMEQYHELHAAEVGPGRIVVHIRNHNQANSGETLQIESIDGGRSWSAPHPIGVWGLPSHLTRLRDGRLLMSYGYRRKPYGVQVRVSADAGSSWSEPLSISSDGASGDLGYPSTVELAGDTMLTVWYELMRGSSRAVLRQARWRLTAV